MSCKFTLEKKNTWSFSCTLLTIILKLSRRLNCLVLPSSVISSGTAKLTTSWRKLIPKCLCFGNSRLQVWTPRNYSLSTRGILGHYLKMLPPLWHPGLTKQQVDQFENIQKRVCKYILGRNYKSYTESLATLEMKTLHDRRVDICSDFAGKDLVSDRFSIWFTSPVKDSFMQLRRSHVVKPFRYKTERFKSCPLPYMANLLNAWFPFVYSLSVIIFWPCSWYVILPAFFLFYVCINLFAINVHYIFFFDVCKQCFYCIIILL